MEADDFFNFLEEELQCVMFTQEEFNAFIAKPLFKKGGQVLDGMSTARATMLEQYLANPEKPIEKIVGVGLPKRKSGDTFTKTREEIDYPPRQVKKVKGSKTEVGEEQLVPIPVLSSR